MLVQIFWMSETFFHGSLVANFHQQTEQRLDQKFLSSATESCGDHGAHATHTTCASCGVWGHTTACCLNMHSSLLRYEEWMKLFCVSPQRVLAPRLVSLSSVVLSKAKPLIYYTLLCTKQRTKLAISWQIWWSTCGHARQKDGKWLKIENQLPIQQHQQRKLTRQRKEGRKESYEEMRE